jgi:dolichyl-phosphate-mannose-protein mannosyltransferase
MKDLIKKIHPWFYPAGLLLAALLTYGINYGMPNSLFWDENYHVASAQKHIDRVMYMEPHPPLGKMLMALGETLVSFNKDLDKSAFNRTDYITGNDVPEGFTFWGFRLPSTFLMAFSVLFLYGILHRLIRHRWLATVFCLPLIFDNAMVVHSRSAMLEGIQFFFILGALYYFVRVITGKDKILLRHYAILSVWIGLATAVKVNGLVLLLLMPMLYFVDQWQNIKEWRFVELIKRLLTSVPSGTLPAAAVFFGIFYIHIGMGTEVINNRTYKASPEYLNLIRQGETFSLKAFTTGMKDHWRYMSEYADGVPRLDMCKSGENGSHVMGWPLGTKTISYRWGKDTYADGVVKTNYTYLVSNPIVWFSALAGIVLSCGLIISRFVYGQEPKDTKLFYWICAFTSLYLAYMIAMLQIERVMYLYHYLVPLLFAMINLALVFNYIYRDEILANNKHTLINLGGFALLVIGVFAFFSPLTYAIPITAEQFELRDWFAFWRLEVVR